jgi:hypothetical protein
MLLILPALKEDADYVLAGVRLAAKYKVSTSEIDLLLLGPPQSMSNLTGEFRSVLYTNLDAVDTLHQEIEQVVRSAMQIEPVVIVAAHPGTPSGRVIRLAIRVPGVTVTGLPG